MMKVFEVTIKFEVGANNIRTEKAENKQKAIIQALNKLHGREFDRSIEAEAIEINH